MQVSPALAEFIADRHLGVLVTLRVSGGAQPQQIYTAFARFLPPTAKHAASGCAMGMKSCGE